MLNLQNELQNGILLFDGAMGTMLQAAGLKAGELPERFTLEKPEIVTGIHRAYVEAGSDVVSANTFSANALKLGDDVEAAIGAGIRAARGSGARFVAQDIGPLGQMLEPLGTLPFERAYDLFAQQVRAGAGADLIIIETMSDLYEAKAALLAAKENSSLPVIVSMTYQNDGRTFMGCDALSATLTLQALGADAVGVNCSLGPAELVPIVETILRYARVPVLVQANAGLPLFDGETTTYPVGADEFASYARKFAEMGAGILGGCCGTSPETIRRIREAVAGRPYRQPQPQRVTAAVGTSKTAVFDGRFTVIGERLNPTGKKDLQAALREGDYEYLANEAIDQVQSGADVLDVNVGLPELDEPAVMAKAVQAIQGAVSVPLSIDSANAAALEAGVRACAGRPIINSVNGKQAVLDAVLPIVKKYGALVIALAMDESIPETAEGRLAIARRIVEEAAKYGIPQEDILVDCLTLTAGAQQRQVLETLRAVALVERELGVKTVLGVSNVSFGLPGRPLLNATFLAAAMGAGLSGAIINPLDARYQEAVAAWRVFSGEDAGAADYVARFAGGAASAETGGARSLKDIIIEGRVHEAADAVRALLEGGTEPLDVINGHFVPALDHVGARYEKSEIFLPQLMQSADAVKNGFAVLKAALPGGAHTRGRILLATVEGDIHDIGKNIVRMLLENYGYDVTDLGKDVRAEDIAAAAKERGITLVGLSALMTTTVHNMKKTIEECREAGVQCAFMVGGAVLSEEYRVFVGADYYAKDAMRGVEIAARHFAE